MGETDFTEVQDDIDEVIDAFLSGRKAPDAFKRLTTWLNAFEGDEPFDYDRVIRVLSIGSAQERLAEVEDSEIAAALGLEDNAVPSKAHKLRYFEGFLLDHLYEDADLSLSFLPVTISSSSGKTAVLFQNVRGYSFSEVTVEWYGPKVSFEEFDESLRPEDWIYDVDVFRDYSRRKKYRMLGIE